MGVKTASAYAVGDTVNLMYNGSLLPFLVVHQGNPSTSIYDGSCAGTWLVESTVASRAAIAFGSSQSYEASTLRTTIEGYYSNFGAAERAAIKQVRIPYRPGTGESRTCNTLGNGLQCHIFLPSLLELGIASASTIPTNEGAPLAYFTSTTRRRGGYEYWTRTPYCNKRTLNCWTINTSGSNTNRAPTASYRVRMMCVIDSGTLFDDTTNTITIPAPVNLRQTGRDYFQISLAWDAVTDASGYRVYRDGDLIATQAAASYTDNDVEPSNEYTYAVEAYNAACVSEQTSIIAATKEGYVYEGVTIDAASCTPQQTTINSPVLLAVSVIEESRILDPMFPRCGQTLIYSGEVIFYGN